MSEKPHKGEIHRWFKHAHKDAGGLGYIVRGTVYNHPEFGNTSGGFFHTSWIVSHDSATGEIETANSRYTLVGPETEPYTQYVKADLSGGVIAVKGDGSTVRVL